jgi:hypothetical protein
MRHRMADLVAQHCGQARIIPGDRQNACVNANLAARQTKRVCFFAIEHHELPLSIRQVFAGDLSDSMSNTLHHRIGGGIATYRRIGLELVETG